MLLSVGDDLTLMTPQIWGNFISDPRFNYTKRKKIAWTQGFYGKNSAERRPIEIFVDVGHIQQLQVKAKHVGHEGRVLANDAAATNLEGLCALSLAALMLERFHHHSEA
jgi:hypothetical protein